MEEVIFRFRNLTIVVWPRFDRAAIVSPLGEAMNLTIGELMEAARLAADAKGR